MDVEDIFANQLKTVIVFLILAAFYIGPLILLYVTFWLVSLPLRRRERARLFLDLLELGLNDGHTAERAIVEAASSKDTVLGWQFRFLAELVKGGMPLAKALQMVPRLVPPPIAAMLKVGAEIGDVRRVLPACRQMLNDALSQTRGALNYLAILTFVVLPVVPIVSLIMITFVMPKFEMIARDMGQGLPVMSQITFGFSRPFVLLQIVVMLGFQFLMLCYIAGPRMKGWLRWLSFLVDRLHWCLPWRRKRMQRDFATMLALLLDSGVPEQRAVMLAAESANNSLFTRRARRAAEQISAGTTLTEAVRALDSSGEFHWRLANATHGPQGFIAALRGWFEALDAKAFQQEQAAAQTLTTALVVWNGFVIGVFVIGMFNVLTNLVQEATLW
jgi:type II secretory pathway component PulF